MRILISRPDRIGDVVLSTAIPREIKKHFPDSEVFFLLRKYTEDLYKNNPYLDGIILFEPKEKFDRHYFFEKLKEIKKYNFDSALMLLPHEQINYMLFLAGIKNRIGSGHKLFQMMTGVKSVSRNKYIPLRHEADYCMDLVRKLGISTNSIEPEIYFSAEEKKEIEQIKNNYLNKKTIGIHISSGNSAPNWKEDRYIELIETLKTFDNIQVVVTDNNISERMKNLTGVLFPNIGNPLRKTILNIASLDCLLSASTGPMHIAAAANVKTVSLFCPLTACNPKLWGPLGNSAIVSMPEKEYCATKCPGDPKKCNLSLEGGITSDEILRKLRSFLDF